MTTIVGVQYQDHSIIAGDTGIFAEGKIYAHDDMVKVIEKNGYVIAAAGDFRVLQLVLHAWTPPKIPVRYKEKLYEAMINIIVPSLRKLFEDNSIVFDKDTDIGILISVNGQIFEIDQFYTVARNNHGYYGIGSGSDFALGALMADASPELAVEIASRNNNQTSNEVKVIKQYSN